MAAHYLEAAQHYIQASAIILQRHCTREGEVYKLQRETTIDVHAIAEKCSQLVGVEEPDFLAYVAHSPDNEFYERYIVPQFTAECTDEKKNIMQELSRLLWRQITREESRENLEAQLAKLNIG